MSNNAQLMAEWDWNKNSNLGFNPKEITYHSGKKVWWICEKGHSFDATVANRANGKGCPICAGRKVLVGYNDLETWCVNNNRLDLIEEFDNEKNAVSMKNITKSDTTSMVCRITSQIIGEFGVNVKALTMVILPL